MPHWLVVLEQVGPMLLEFTPLAPLTGAVIAGIKVANLIPGATGDQKKALVMQIVAASVQGTNAQAGHTVIDPTESVAAADSTIDTVIHVTNVISAARQAQQAQAAAQATASNPALAPQQ